MNTIVQLFHKLLTQQVTLISEFRDRSEVEPTQVNVLEDLIDGWELAKILKISTSTLYRLKRNKEIKAIRIGKRDYYSKKEINKLVYKFMK